MKTNATNTQAGSFFAFFCLLSRFVFALLFAFVLLFAVFLHVFHVSLGFFPNSHAMGSCKTNRRTGAVGSPSELVGGWCPGHVLMASGSCDAGVPVSRSCFDCDPIML